MITNSSLRKNIAEKSHELSKTFFNLQNIGVQLDNMYTSLLSKHNSAIKVGKKNIFY